MNVTNLLCLLALGLCAHAKCPAGTTEGLANDCYLFNSSLTAWQAAELDCVSRKGHLASVSSALTNALLRKIGSRSSEFWLDGSFASKTQWTWSDGRPFSYTNWAAGQPVNSASYCVSMDAATGRWHSRPRGGRKPYICKVPSVGASTPSPTRTPSGACPIGWTFVAAAGRKCLRSLLARTECRNTAGADLVSIHSAVANKAVRDFAYRNTNMGSYDYNWFHIGLRRPSAGAAWQWTDGTPVDFVNWQPGYGGSPGDTTATLGVFGRYEGNYDTKDAVWQSDSPNSAAWRGVCELTL